MPLDMDPLQPPQLSRHVIHQPEVMLHMPDRHPNHTTSGREVWELITIQANQVFRISWSPQERHGSLVEQAFI